MQDCFGFELFLAQPGQHPPSAKLLKGLGSGIVELVEDFDGTMRIIRFAEELRAEGISLPAAIVPGPDVRKAA